MKTLKKVLSVALVLAMALSLVTITSAAGVSKYQDFTDAADIANQEAVDLLTAIGVINGMPDGSYDPKGYVTRAQAAKIITYLLLGEKAAANLKASAAPFADVPVDHWAAPYIQFCVTRGIINGVGDNKFDPDGQVTAAQFAKMLLVAAGYGKLGEYVGADWAINTIVDAQNLKILDTNVDYMAPANRDEIARYAFNFYTKVSLVYYDSDKGIYDELYDNGDTLADRQNVVAADAQTPVNGLPSRIWKKDGKVLTGNYFPKEDGKVLATGVYDGVFFTVEGYTKPTNPNRLDFDTSLTVYLNGNEVSDATLPEDADKKMMRGDIFSLIDAEGDGDVDIVSIIQKKADKLFADVNVNTAGYVTLPGTELPSTDKKLIVGYEGLKKGDVVVYYTDEATGITYVEKATPVMGVVTGIIATNQMGSIPADVSRVDIDGVPYYTYVDNKAANNNSAVDMFIVGGTLDTTRLQRSVVAYVDSNRYIVYIEFADVTVSDPYGIVLSYAKIPGYFQNEVVGYTVRILKEDGTVAVYQQAPDASGAYTAKFSLDEDDSIDPFALVTYSFTDDGKIRFTVKDNFEEKTLGQAYAAGSNQVVLSGSGTKYLSKNTKVFYAESKSYDSKKKYGAITGYTNTKELETGEVYIYTKTGSDVLDVIVFITEPDITTPPQYAFANPFTGGLFWTTTKLINGYAYKDATVFKDVQNPSATLTAPLDKIGTGTDKIPEYGCYGIIEYTLDGDGYVKSVSNTSGSTKVDIHNWYPYDNNYKQDLAQLPYVTYVDVAGDYFLYDGKDRGSVLVDENTKFYKFDLDTYAITEGNIAASSGNVKYRLISYMTYEGVATQVFYTVDIETVTTPQI